MLLPFFKTRLELLEYLSLNFSFLHPAPSSVPDLTDTCYLSMLNNEVAIIFMLLCMETCIQSILPTQFPLFIQVQLKTHCLDNTLTQPTHSGIFPEYLGRYKERQHVDQIIPCRSRCLHVSAESVLCCCTYIYSVSSRQ